EHFRRITILKRKRKELEEVRICKSKITFPEEVFRPVFLLDGNKYILVEALPVCFKKLLMNDTGKPDDFGIIPLKLPGNAGVMHWQVIALNNFILNKFICS